MKTETHGEYMKTQTHLNAVWYFWRPSQGEKQSLVRERELRLSDSQHPRQDAAHGDGIEGHGHGSDHLDEEGFSLPYPFTLVVSSSSYNSSNTSSGCMLYCHRMSSKVGHCTLLLMATVAVHEETNPMLNVYVLTLMYDQSYLSRFELCPRPNPLHLDYHLIWK